MRLGWRLARAGGVAVAVLFLVAPLLAIVYAAFSPFVYPAVPPAGLSLRWFEKLSDTPQLIAAFLRSLGMAVVVAPLTAILGLAAGLALEAGRRTRRLGELLFQAPLLVPELILGIALLQFYALFDLDDTYSGVLLAHVVVAFPFFLRAVDVGLAARDRRLEEAATILGASPLRAFWTITMPEIRPAVASGLVFAFVTSFDQFSVALFVVGTSTETLPVAIYNYLFDNSDPVVAAASLIIIVIGLAAALLTHRLVGLDRVFIGGPGRPVTAERRA